MKRLFALLLSLVVASCTPAYAGPIAAAQGQGTSIVLFTEPCTLQAVVDLPNRATWTEKGKVFEGCYGLHPQFQVVVAYFSDRSIVILPPNAFKPLTGV